MRAFPRGARRPVARLAVRGLFLLLAGVFFPTAAEAQTRMVLGVDASVRSSHAWRGFARGSGWVLQPDLYLAAVRQPAAVTVGWWSNVELSSNDPGDPGDSGLGQAWFGENDLWAEAGGRLGAVDLSGGIVRYLHADGAFGQGADALSTTELYANVGVGFGPTVPRVTLWYDVDRIRGAYIETRVDLRVPVLPSYDPVLALYLCTLAGWSVGQEVDENRPGQPAYFREAGLTHIDLGLEARAGRKWRYATLEVHFLPVRDPGARSGPGPAAPRGSSWWLGLSFSDGWVLGVI